MGHEEEPGGLTLTLTWGRRARRATMGVILHQIEMLHGKVDALMAFDMTVVARLVAGAGALVEQNRLLVAERDTLKTTLGEARAAEALEDQDEAAASADILAAAEAVDALLRGPETPNIPVPPIEAVPPIVDGTTPVTDQTGNPVTPDTTT